MLIQSTFKLRSLSSYQAPTLCRLELISVPATIKPLNVTFNDVLLFRHVHRFPFIMTKNLFSIMSVEGSLLQKRKQGGSYQAAGERI